MPQPSLRTTLIVIYSPLLEQCRRFYEALGLTFAAEKHGNGPEHYAAVLPDGMVFELYPATSERHTGSLRLGFSVDGHVAGLRPGRHLLTDPDGRTVDVHAVTRPG